MKTTEEMIEQMYDSQLNSQKEQLKTDYETTLSDMDAQQAAAHRALDQNLRDTRVDSQRSAVNNAEYYAAAGLSSGARAQAKLSQENQLLSNLTALRAAQQQADAETERQRTLLAKEYASAIQKAQADNDLARAQALYEEAKSEEEQMLAKQQASAQLLAQNGDYSRLGALYGLTPEQIAALTAQYQKEQNRPDREAAAGLMAQVGDYSGLGALYGLTPEQVQALTTNYTTEKERANKEAAAQLMAQTGDYSRLGALYGLTPEEIAKLSGGSTGNSGSGGSSGGNTGSKYSGKANNGDVPTAYIIAMQDYLGVTPDGKWGPKSRAAAGKLWGTTDPDTAWAKIGATLKPADSVEAFKNRNMTREQAISRGIGETSWEAMILKELNNANLTGTEFAELEKYYGIG